MFPLVSTILRVNGLNRSHYAEPYAGGGSLALALLFSGRASDIHLNDVDEGIWSFWYCVLNQTDALIEKIESTQVTVEEWRRQRAVYKSPCPRSELDLGFATFFLNRTNRSGIISTAGVIGGLEQRGNYKIDCRFNVEELVRRIKRIARYRGRIHLYREDALDFLKRIDQLLPKRTFTAIDPPYFQKGSSLYTSFYNPDDHAKVAAEILKFEKPWILTYDDAPEIRRLYSSRRQYLFDIKYSVQTKRIGTELLIPSKGLVMPTDVKEAQVHRPQYRAAA